MADALGGEVVVYEAPDGVVRVDVRLEQETVWLTQQQMAEVFGRERSVITKHLRNVFKDGELKPESVRARFAHTGADNKTYQVDFYNLDAILSVGYRVNSKRGTQFRIWATTTRRDHLLRGYTLPRSAATPWPGSSARSNKPSAGSRSTRAHRHEPRTCCTS